MIKSELDEDNLRFIMRCFTGKCRHQLTIYEIWALLGENWDEFISDIIPDTDYNECEFNDYDDLDLKELERKAILKALERNDYSQQKAASDLGVSPRKLNYKIMTHKINHPDWKRIND